MNRQFRVPEVQATYRLPETHHYQILEPDGKTSAPMDEAGIYAAIQGGEIVPSTRLTDRRDGRVFTAQEHPAFAATLRQFGYPIAPPMHTPAPTQQTPSERSPLFVPMFFFGVGFIAVFLLLCILAAATLSR